MAKSHQDVDIGRLCAAVQRARLVLRRPRQERFDAVKQYVGQHWSDEGTTKEVPVNIISLYTSIVGRKLIANNPRVMLSTWDRGSKPTVTAMQSWANKEIERSQLANTLQRVVLDALFSIGVCKVALATPGDSATLGWGLAPGQPFAERVDLDDLVFDIHARDLNEVSFIGHRYRCPLQVIRDSKMYSKDRKDLTASDDRIYNMEGDERIGLLGRTTLAGSDTEEFEDFVDLWEVYLPRHRLVITLRDDNLIGAMGGYESSQDPHYGKALRIQNWLGPETGPYHILGFGIVPGNPMPKAPIQDLIDLHMAVNRLLRKLIRQADRQKEVTFVQGAAAEDGSRLMQTNDGEATRVDNPDKIQITNWGGPNQGNFQLFMALKDLVSWLAGNLDIMGGLSPQAKTATQDEMLNANASASISAMQDRTVIFTAGVVKALCWYWHHDPQKVMRSRYSLPGMPELAITRRVHPAGRGIAPDGRRRLSRDHAFDDMDIKVDPYSLQHQTPQMRLAGLNQIVTQIITPMMPLLQQQGIAFDLNAYLQKVAAYMDMPDLGDIVTVREPPQPDTQGAPGAGPEPGKPPETTRNYVRRSIGGTPAGQGQAMEQMLSGQQDERNGVQLNGAR